MWNENRMVGNVLHRAHVSGNCDMCQGLELWVWGLWHFLGLTSSPKTLIWCFIVNLWPLQRAHFLGCCDWVLWALYDNVAFCHGLEVWVWEGGHLKEHTSLTSKGTLVRLWVECARPIGAGSNTFPLRLEELCQLEPFGYQCENELDPVDISMDSSPEPEEPNVNAWPTCPMEES